METLNVTRQISEEFYNKANNVLKQFGKSNSNSLRLESKRLKTVFDSVMGQEFEWCLEVLIVK